MKGKAMDWPYIGIMTCLYGLMLIGAIFAASAFPAESPAEFLNVIHRMLVQSLNGVSFLLVLAGVLLFLTGMLARSMAEK
ncbi:MAG TPA: hypothetical protein VLD37_03760 [Candidatus Bilamarchaeum sp.]|nr:hypothetical protein [Candidatus Bilamarchaeum sp.]